MEENLKFDSATEEVFILSYMIKDIPFFLKISKYLQTNDFKKKSYFIDNKLQFILNFCLKYYDSYERVPSKETVSMVVEKKFKDDLLLSKAIKNCIENVYTKDLSCMEPDYIKDETVKFIRTMKAYEATNLNQLDIANGKFDNLADRMQKALNINLDKDLGISISNIKETLALIQQADSDSGISFGSPILDTTIGGIRAGEIAVICGTPGIGKTIWLGNIAVENMRTGKKGVFFSLEVDKKRLAKRLYSSLLLRKGADLNNIKKEEVEAIFNEFQGGDIRIKNYAANIASCNDFASYLNELYTIEGFIPDFIVIDYILITAPNSHQLAQGENTYAKYKAVTEEMRNLAVQFNCPVFTAAQINRNGMGDKGGTKGVVTSKDLSESRGILDTADYLLIINQTDQEKKLGEKDGISEQRLFIDKSRNSGGQQTFTFTIDYNTMRITEGKKNRAF